MARRIFATFILIIACLSLSVGLAYGAATSGYADNPPGQNPHGGYTVSSKKCSVCHAVHKAGAESGGVGSEFLLRSQAADACTYCHINPGVSTLIVYGGDSTKYTGTDYANSHNNAGVTPVTCVICHQVHAAQAEMTDNASLTAKILIKANPLIGYDWDSDWANEGKPLASDNYELALTKWCTRCHTYWPGTNPGLDVDSHVLVAADNTHAWSPSETCRSCHNSNTLGGVVPTASVFPHYSDGARFLTESAGGSANSTWAVTGSDDGVCLRCHRQAPAGPGVGVTF